MERDQAVKFIHELLRGLVAKKASDLFITAGFPPAFKIDGKMTPVSNQSLTPQHTQELARSLMNDKQAGEFEAIEAPARLEWLLQSDEPQVFGRRAHGHRFLRLQWEGGKRRIVVAIVLAQFDEAANIGTGRDQLITLCSLIGKWKENLSIRLLAGQSPGVAYADVAVP